MAWIEFHPSDIVRLKKFHDLRKSCNWSSFECLGFLGRFWGLVIEVRENGDVSDWDADYLTEVMGFTDQVGKRAWDALRQHGWLETKDGGKVVVHDWLDYAGAFLRGKYSGEKQRPKLVEIWAFHGREYGSNSKPIGNLSGTDREPILPNLTVPNHTVPDLKEEKSKERACKFVPGGSFWKTCRDLFLTGSSELSSVTWPSSGMMLDGRCWELTRPAPRTKEKDGSLWPTLTASQRGATTAERNAKRLGGVSLESALARWESPKNRKNGPGVHGGLNPNFLEWFMGFPTGWTERKLSETRKSRSMRR